MNHNRIRRILCLHFLVLVGLAPFAPVIFDIVNPAVTTAQDIPSAIVVKPLTARIDPEQITVRQGQSAVFNSTSIARPNVPISSYQWSGPSGQRSASARFVVNTTQITPGTYTITLAVTDARQARSRATARLVVQATQRPEARITPINPEVTQGKSVRFISSSFHPAPRSRIVRYQWRTQWGQTSSGDELIVTTARLEPSRYWVTLRVFDERGATDMARTSLQVLAAPQPPQVSIEPLSQSVKQGEPAIFTGNATDPDGKIRRWSWLLNGRAIATGRQATIDTRNLKPATYAVMLEVTDSQGLQAKAGARLFVTEAIPQGDLALTRLTITPTAIFPKQQATIIATVTNHGDEPIQNIPVQFEVAGRRFIERIESLEPRSAREVPLRWTATRETGEQIVTAVVDPASRYDKINRTNNARTAAIIVQPPLELTIAPNRLELNQGQRASFMAEVSPPAAVGGRRFSFAWSGPAGTASETNVFELETARLNPGQYPIAVLVRADKETLAEARAILIVRETPIELELTADRNRITVGDSIEYRGALQPERAGITFKFDFGDGQSTEWTDSLQASHNYERPGAYTTTFSARQGDRILGTTTTRIEVSQIVYGARINHDPPSPMLGDTVRFTAVIEPPTDGAEYQFRFGDGLQTAWQPAPSITHVYQRPGEFVASAAVRLPDGQIVQSTTLAIAIAEQQSSPLPWFLSGAAVLLGAMGIGYIAGRRKGPDSTDAVPPPKINFEPRLNKDQMKTDTDDAIISEPTLRLCSVRGEAEHQIETNGSLIDQQKS